MKGPPTFKWYPNESTGGWTLAAETPQPSTMTVPLVEVWLVGSKVRWRHVGWPEDFYSDEDSMEVALEAIIFMLQDDWRPLVPPVPV